jgi:hypothetical protein
MSTNGTERWLTNPSGVGDWMIQGMAVAMFLGIVAIMFTLLLIVAKYSKYRGYSSSSEDRDRGLAREENDAEEARERIRYRERAQQRNRSQELEREQERPETLDLEDPLPPYVAVANSRDGGEKCETCGRIIGKREQAYLHCDCVVCKHCKDLLTAES